MYIMLDNSIRRQLLFWPCNVVSNNKVLWIKRFINVDGADQLIYQVDFL